MLSTKQIESAMRLSGHELYDRCREKLKAGTLTKSEMKLLCESWLVDRGFFHSEDGWIKDRELSEVAKDIGLV